MSITTTSAAQVFERRNLIEPVEVRSEGDELVAYGYAYKFNVLSSNLGGWVETIHAGAGKKSIEESDIRGLFNHDPNLVLGRMRSGTLSMEEDGTGGAYEIRLPDTSTGREVATLLERGDIDGSSFGFRVIDYDWHETDQGFPLRILKQFSIRDVGPVTFPAYPDADSALRSFADDRELDLAEVRAAAEQNRLVDLIRSADEDLEQNNEHEDGPGETHPLRQFRHLQ